MYKYIWPVRNKLSHKNRWLETFEKNYPTIALNILYIKEKKICTASL